MPRGRTRPKNCVKKQLALNLDADKDQEMINWCRNQKNLTQSVEILIRKWVQQYGTDDLIMVAMNHLTESAGTVRPQNAAPKAALQDGGARKAPARSGSCKAENESDQNREEMVESVFEAELEESSSLAEEISEVKNSAGQYNTGPEEFTQALAPDKAKKTAPRKKSLIRSMDGKAADRNPFDTIDIG